MLKPSKAFSLIELSIVIVIIGFMMSFVLRGSNIASNSQLNSIMSDVKYYAAQTDKFVNLYGGLPGDFVNITNLPSNCNTNGNLQAGDGNGVIDSLQESLQYWLHLECAGLISGYFSGQKTTTPTAYNPANPNIIGYYPAGKYPLSVINVDYVNTTQSNGLSYIISKNITIDNTLTNATYPALLTPLDAYNFDKKYDDGNPTTGIITANPHSAATDNCYTNTTNSDNKATAKYNLSYTRIACYVEINVEDKTTSNIAGSSNNSCQFGQSRIATSYACPIGYVGTALEHCTFNNLKVPAWVQVRKFCEPISCGGGLTYLQTVDVPCAPGYTGTATLQYTCGPYGVLQPPSDLSNCASENDAPCASTGATRTFPCPVGYTGTWSQKCSGSAPALTWQTDTSITTCSPMTCSGVQNIGDAVSSINLGTNLGCPDTYWSALTESNGTTKSGPAGVCVLPITQSPNPKNLNNAATAILAKTYCVPGGSSTASLISFNSTPPKPSNFSCPYGKTSAPSQFISSTALTNSPNVCVPVTCGGEPVGSWRIYPGAACPVVNGLPSIGNVLEICMYTDNDPSKCDKYCGTAQWKVSYAGCNEQ